MLLLQHQVLMRATVSSSCIIHSATDYVVTIAENNGGSATIGTFTMLANTSELCRKKPNKCCFC